MACVYVSIGSNRDRYRHVSIALDALQARFGELKVSPVYESESIGFAGSHFLNLVVEFNTQLSVAELAVQLKDLEYANGRQVDAPRFAPRTLDIDILTYDQLVGEFPGVNLPRAEITENAFVLLPLRDIAADVFHPVVNRTYDQLWQAYDQRSQRLWPVDFQWRGRIISQSIAVS